LRVRRDGRLVHVSLTISAVRDTLNKVIGISKIARDVSERIAVEDQLRDQAKHRDMFLAMLSHELRNPLSAVLTASHVLFDQRVSSSIQSQAVATIRRQASMISSLLDDLLDVSRISLGKIELSRSTFNLVDLIETIRETTLPEITAHQATLHFEVADPELLVDADAARLVQVHVNLIHNAAKYSPPGSPIFVNMRSENGSAVITVRDEGAGICADFLPRIFDPFVQSDETLGRSEGGLGVGLTLVKSIVELHRGSVEAFSDGRDRGSTFVIRIPLVSPRPQVVAAREGTDDLGAASATSNHPARPAVRIVLVEDIDDNREMMKAILELDGHEVIPAENGEAGCDAILQHRPDLALIDIGLPGIDGYEVARRVRQSPVCGRVKLIALTGYGQQSDVTHALAAGFDAHLVKPVNPRELSALIQSRNNWS
jgi:two-component system CheB/CheR fusion protein